ncbi:hypothetical protein CR513_10384, partial [Mucuna pruriens]
MPKAHDKIGTIDLGPSRESRPSSTNNFAKPKQMENNDRTLKKLAIPDVAYQPWCIQRRSLQVLEGISCGLFHNEAVED